METDDIPGLRKITSLSIVAKRWLKVKVSVTLESISARQKKKYDKLHEQAMLELNLTGDDENLEMYSSENIMKRSNIKHKREIKHLIQQFWDVADFLKVDHSLDKAGYIVLNTKMHLALVPHISMKKAKISAEIDWVHDTKGEKCLNRPLFFDSMFELADVWCEDIDSEQYASFLQNMLDATCKMDNRTGKYALRGDDEVIRLVTVEDIQEEQPANLPLKANRKKSTLAFHTDMG